MSLVDKLKPTAADATYVLYVFREASHPLGYADVVTKEDKKTPAYHLTQDQVGVFSLRKGTFDGPILALIRIASPVHPASVALPSSVDREKGLAWSTTFEEGGVYQKKFLFEDPHRFKYSWRNVATALPTSALELWSETLNRRIATFRRPIYTPQDKSCKFELDIGFRKDVDFLLATAIAMEELDALKRGTRPPLAVAEPLDDRLLPTYTASTSTGTIKLNDSHAK